MTYIVDLNAFELHPREGKKNQRLYDECKGFAFYI